MMQRTRTYVTLVCVAALCFVAAVYHVQPGATPSELSAVAVLAALAAFAELLTYALPRSSYGSIAFIPYLAAVVVVPAWPTVVACALVKLATEILQRRTFEKRAFNVAQIAITLSAAVLTYRMLGGEGLLLHAFSDFGDTTAASGLPALSAFVAAFAVNSILVQGVVALANGISFKQAFRENVALGIGLDLLASPIVFLFAWIYAQWGSIAAFAFWAPILGLRHLTTTSLELEQTNQELLELMVKSIEARDSYTSGHSRRVRDYAEVIARAAGLSDRDVARISKAALLHDVGKIHEKYAPILAKPDKLTPDEWRLMRQHPNDGAELVGTMTRLRELIPAVRHHHEQWDGGGYPDGLARDAIPLEARIIALADTIDAMTTERPYRPALSADEVRLELVRCRAKQFDPALVDRLLNHSSWVKLFGPDHPSGRYGALAVVPDGARARSVNAV